jgi:hypothetical protein
LTLPGRVNGRAMKLSGPTLESTDGVEFGEVHIPRSREVLIAAHTGMIYEI